MRNALLLVGLGIAIGYFLGFDDARRHEQNLLDRAVVWTRGAFGDHHPNDIDAAMSRVEDQKK